ncbi:alpha/beta hydrolase [Maricaulis sp. CAU 1757]
MKAGLVIIGALVVACLVATGARAAPPLSSVADLEQELRARPHAEDEVWRRITARGLPLLDRHPDDTDLSRITFLFRAPPGTRSVRLDSVVNAVERPGPVTDYVADFTLPMRPVANSSIFALTLDAPRDLQAAYSFLVDAGDGWQRHTDPANPRRLGGIGSEAVLVLDAAEPDRALRPRRDSVERRDLTIDSQSLKRPVRVRLHRAAGGHEHSPVLILYDDFLWGVRAPAWQIVANLAEAGRIPPTHVVLIDQLDSASAGQRYADQAAFIATELLPGLRREAGLEPPRRAVVVGGASRRGLAGSIAALAHPDRIGGVLSMSGSFYWAPEGEAPEWLLRELASRPAADAAARPRFHLAVGSLETVVTATNAGHVMMDANRRMEAGLTEAGYEAALAVYGGGHDVAGWRQALVGGLVALIGDAE